MKENVKCLWPLWLLRVLGAYRTPENHPLFMEVANASIFSFYGQCDGGQHKRCWGRFTVPRRHGADPDCERDKELSLIHI